MKSTICTEAGRIVLEATPAGVILNGKRMLPHEAFLLASELQRAAQNSAKRTEAYIAKYHAKAAAA